MYYLVNIKTEKVKARNSKNNFLVQENEKLIESDQEHSLKGLHYNEQDGFYTKENTQPPQPQQALAELRSLLVEWEDGDQDKADDRLNDILQSDKTLDLFVQQGNYERFIQRLERGPASDLITTTELSEVKSLLNVEDTDNA